MLAFQAWRYNTEVCARARASTHAPRAHSCWAQERMEAAPIVRAMRRRRLSPGNELGTGGTGA